MAKKVRIHFLCVCLLFFAASVHGQSVEYPYPVKSFNLYVEKQQVTMAYMDVPPSSKANGQTIVLLHGKNFNGFYWKDVIDVLIKNGYRVIVPDQAGWGKSSKPDIHYSFHMLANNTKLLLDSLHINQVVVVGHSMGGMLATRFALMFPQRTSLLILENPIGLEDYKRFVPYKTLTELYQNELSATYESYKKYQQSYYPVWKPEYEVLVKAQAEALTAADFPSVAWANALTYQMIYEQPVVYEFDSLKMPVLLIIGQEDRTVVGKKDLTEVQKKMYGNYPALGKKVKRLIPRCTLVELPGVGHIPHIQSTAEFNNHLLTFLRNSKP